MSLPIIDETKVKIDHKLCGKMRKYEK